MDFLLTHYHADHYDGTIYMSSNSTKRFDDVYIPDIWNINGNVDVVSLILLRGLLAKSTLRKRLTLTRFLISICKATGCIHFVKRNSTIQEDYIALWPSDNYILNRTAREYDNLFPLGNGENTLRRLAEHLVEVVVSLGNTNGEVERLQVIGELEQLDREYTELDLRYPADGKSLYKLSNLGNEISIVFQNECASEKCVLFTGDVRGNSMWKFIENNKDGRIDMHEKYQIIKIPHHGTNPYYHSFAKYIDQNTYYLIPNGDIGRNSWHISSSYATDITANNCNVVCSNNNACHSAPHGRCTCGKCFFAHNVNGYYDI